MQLQSSRLAAASHQPSSHVGASPAWTAYRVLPYAPLHQPHPRRSACAASKRSGHPSFDSEDELDRKLSEELVAVVDPARMQRMQRHLDLIWRVTKAKSKTQQCSCCSGSGDSECGWCHGTGFLTVGDKLYTNIGNGQCPVCKASGYTKCEMCRGTGAVAAWMGPDILPGGFSKQAGTRPH